MKKEFEKYIIIGILCFVICLGTYFYYLQPYAFSKRDYYVFGACFMTMNNPYYEVVNNEIKKEVEYNGDQLITLDPLLDQDKQNEQIESLIEKNVDAIFVTPIDSNAIESTLEKAKNANIPVIAVDVPVPTSDLVSSTIVSDNYDAGVQCAKAMMKERDKANILLLEHNEVLSAVERIQGFKDTIKKNKNYKVIDETDCKGQIEIAYPKTEKMLEKYNNIDVIFALNDPSAIGALAAVQSKGLNDISVYGVDGTPDCKKLIGKGITGTCAQYPIKTGDKAIEIGYKIVENKSYENYVTMDVTLITKKNIDVFDLEGWQ